MHIDAENRPILVRNNSHDQLELALAEAFEADDAFKEVNDMALWLSLHFRSIGDAKQINMATAMALEIIM